MFTLSQLPKICQCQLITVARISLQQSRKTVIFWPCFIFFYFPPHIFRRPWADFCKILHTMQCVLKYLISYMGVHVCPLKHLRGKKPNICRFADPKSTIWAPSFPTVGKIRKPKTIGSICGYVRTSIPNTVRVPPPHPRNRLSPWCVGWGGASKLWIDITSAVWQLATRCLILRVGFRGQAIRWWHSRERGSKGRCHDNQSLD